MGMIMGAWQLVYIFSAVPSGMLLDRIGPRRALALGGLMIALSALARAFADGYVTMMLAVMLFGLGGPVVSAGAPKVVMDLFTGSKRGLAMGIYMTGPAIGGIVSLTLTHPVLLPLFGNSWRGVMLAWAGFAAASAVLWYVLAGLRTASRAAQSEGGSSLRIMGQLLTRSTVLVVLVMSVCVFMFNHGLNNWLPELLRGTGMTAIEAGYWAAIPTVIGIAGSLLIPRLATPERRFMILLGLSIMACGASVLLRFEETPTLLSGLVLQGIARSSLMTVLILTLVELPEIGERHAGTASGLFFSAAEVGGVMGPLMLGLLFDVSGTFDSGLSLLTLLSMVMVAGSILLQRRARRA